MYDYHRTTNNENNLITNLNSISSSLSSIDTVGTRRTNQATKASVDNLITPRTHSITSTSGLLWQGRDRGNNLNNNINNNGSIYNDRFSTIASVRANANSRLANQENFYGSVRRKNKPSTCCFSTETALNFTLIPLLLLTVTRQVFDFLGQIWLQILINFFTIIFIIVALFGIRQRRISYLSLFAIWSLLSTVWNLIVVCIHTKWRDVGLTEDALSFNTGTYSWWRANGPGCLPLRLSNIQPAQINIIQSTSNSGCRQDYHLIEATQAIVHAMFSFLTALLCSCVISSLRKNPQSFENEAKADKLYRLKNLVSDRRVNQDPFPNNRPRNNPVATGSLGRRVGRSGSRGSQHSMSSVRPASRRRTKQQAEDNLPAPRDSTSSAPRSHRYGSLSSRRSSNRRGERRGDVASLTYGTTAGAGRSSGRTRLSSLSSADYLPSYQPPHSSNTNLLSSYGEISSIDSYNNRTNENRLSRRQRQTHAKAVASQGNTNPTYVGSRSSVYSHNNNPNMPNNSNNTNNYDDLSYIYGYNNSARNGENIYAPGSSVGQQATDSTDAGSRHTKLANGASFQNKRNTFQHQRGSTNSNGFSADRDRNYVQVNGFSGDTMIKSKVDTSATTGLYSSFTPQSAQNMNGRVDAQSRPPAPSHQIKAQDIENNNHLAAPLKSSHDAPNELSNDLRSRSGAINPIDLSRSSHHQPQQQQVAYATQRLTRHPIYSNQVPNGNSETPI